MIFIGIDPGLEGAIAVLIDGQSPQVIDVPVVSVGKKKDYQPVSMTMLLQPYQTIAQAKVMVGLEYVHAMPKNGSIGNFSMGRSSGLWEGILASMRFPYVKILPQRWKKAMLDGMPKEKGSSILVAKRLFPEVDLSRKKDHGRADALLIAAYLRRINISAKPMASDMSQLRQLDG